MTKQRPPRQCAAKHLLAMLDRMKQGFSSFLAIPPKSISERRDPLLIGKGRPRIPCVGGFHEIPRRESPIDQRVGKIRLSVARECGIELLAATLHFDPEAFGEVSRHGNGIVTTLAKGTVELRVVHVQTCPNFPELSQSQTVKLVPGLRAVGARVAPANVNVRCHVPRQIYTNATTKALKKILVQQASTNQRGIKSG